VDQRFLVFLDYAALFFICLTQYLSYYFCLVARGLCEAIEKLAESASEILRVFEPKENGSNAGRNGAVVRPSSYLLPLLDKFRTANWKRIKSELQFSGILELFPTPAFQN
jgi:hypothetical protein